MADVSLLGCAAAAAGYCNDRDSDGFGFVIAVVACRCQ
jgi:hypothetical protein